MFSSAQVKTFNIEEGCQQKFNLQVGRSLAFSRVRNSMWSVLLVPFLMGGSGQRHTSRNGSRLLQHLHRKAAKVQRRMEMGQEQPLTPAVMPTGKGQMQRGLQMENLNKNSEKHLSIFQKKIKKKKIRRERRKKREGEQRKRRLRLMLKPQQMPLPESSRSEKIGRRRSEMKWSKRLKKRETN